MLSTLLILLGMLLYLAGKKWPNPFFNQTSMLFVLLGFIVKVVTGTGTVLFIMTVLQTVGIACNFLVVCANYGYMPVWEIPVKHNACEALKSPNLKPQSLEIVEKLAITPYHTIMTPKSKLKALGDIIPMKFWGISIGMISIGDILIVVPLPIVLIYAIWN